jgi:lysine 2,3-aminomutase
MKNWQESFKNAVKNYDELNQFILKFYPDEKIQFSNDYHFKTFIPYDYLHFIFQSKSEVLKKEFFPHIDESQNQTGLVDPIGDFVHAKGHGIIHRYKNRLLFSPTKVCPIHCRYCFRRNEFESDLLDANWEMAKQYLIQHPEVNEIIFTGGDPLILSNQKLNFYFKELMDVESIRFIRLHTRTPVIIPERLDADFINMIQQYENHFDKIQLVLHINHSDELSFDFKYRMLSLKNQKLNLLSQTVMLKNINDDAIVLETLFFDLLKLGITPYYLHHPDQVKGAMHFGLNLEDGFEIYKTLRQKLPGWAIPHYVVDSPNGKKLVAEAITDKSLLQSPTKAVFSEQNQIF